MTTERKIRYGIGEGMTGEETLKFEILFETLPDDEAMETEIRRIVRNGALAGVTTHDIIEFLHSTGKFVVRREGGSLFIKDKSEIEEVK